MEKYRQWDRLKPWYQLSLEGDLPDYWRRQTAVSNCTTIYSPCIYRHEKQRDFAAILSCLIPKPGPSVKSFWKQ